MRYAPCVGKAFTFIELLITAVIILVLIGISIPQFRKAFDNFELENYAKNVSYLGRYLQASAVSQGRIHALSVMPRENKVYAFFTGEDNQKQRLAGRYGKDYLLPQSASFSSPQEEGFIYFYPDGTAEGADIAINNRDGRKVILSVKGATGEMLFIKEEK